MDDETQCLDWSKEVFSTGEAAKICNISQQTIIRCFDCGTLGGFRVPGSRFRRIPREELIRFMKAHDMRVDRLERSICRVLLVDDSRRTAEALREAFEDDDGVELCVASNGFDAGVQTERFKPHAVLVSTAPRLHWEAIVRSVRGNEQLSGVRIAVIADDGEEIEGIETLHRPFDPSDVRELLSSMLPAPALSGA